MLRLIFLLRGSVGLLLIFEKCFMRLLQCCWGEGILPFIKGVSCVGGGFVRELWIVFIVFQS